LDPSPKLKGEIIVPPQPKPSLPVKCGKSWKNWRM
jgi:hypothetical protein